MVFIYNFIDGAEPQVQDKVVRMVRNGNQSQTDHPGSARPHAETHPVDI